MVQLLWGILFLGIAVTVNWAMGIFQKIGVEKIAWSWVEFGWGLLKIAIIAGSIIGLGVVWQYSGIDLSGAGLEPITLTTTGTMYYAYKAIKHLGSMLHGVTDDEMPTEE